MVENSKLRMGRLFRRDSGRSFMVAFDRTLLAGPVDYAEDPRRALAAVVAGGPEAVLLSPGLLARCADQFAHAAAPRTVVRIDYPMVADFRVNGAECHRMVCEPAHAARLGADAVIMCLIEGYENPDTYADNIAAVADTARKCHELGLPFIVEAVLWGNRVTDPADAERVAAVSRIGAELGADLIKTQYPGSRERMRRVADSCPVPVLVLGGAAMDDPGAVETMTQDALDGGAQGVIYGRNVWQREDVAGMSATLRELIHS